MEQLLFPSASSGLVTVFMVIYAVSPSVGRA
jgi:hypothetical protein